MNILVISLAIILVPAQLCRFYRDFPFPLNEFGFGIRAIWGTFAPYYEHFSYGLGLSLFFGNLVWLTLYVIVPISYSDLSPRNKVWERVRRYVIEPSISRDYIGMLLLPIIYPSFRSWEWELCQAHMPSICQGGNGDGTIQFDQIAFDHAGIVAYLALITIFFWQQRLTHHSTEST